MKRTLTRIIAVLAASAVGSSAMAATFSGLYSENFDSMGAAGTAPPAGWIVKTGDGGSNTTWATSIPASGTLSVATMISTTGVLTAITTPSATNNNSYNAALDAAHTSDRVLSTSPTGVTGAGLELSLTNSTGSAINSLSVSYDTVRFTAVGTANELPGYELFYSLDGATWTNVAALNPTLAGPDGVIVPNTVGVATVSNAAVGLSSSWNDGSTLLLRWVDDNAVQTSPDQIIGLNNVMVSTPEPASISAAAIGAFVLLIRPRKQR